MYSAISLSTRKLHLSICKASLCVQLSTPLEHDSIMIRKNQGFCMITGYPSKLLEKYALLDRVKPTPYLLFPVFMLR